MSRAHIVLGLLAIAGLAAPGRADEIQLHNGGRINGIVVKRTAQAVVVETGPGLVTIPMSRIAGIVAGPSSLETWRERSAALHEGDARGWASLARWAEDAGLTSQARTAWERVLAADPASAEAHRAVGHVQFEGAWMDSDEAYRARGYVQADGRWMTPAEHEAMLRQRELDRAEDTARADADRRVREAEARADEAEAAAQAAQSQPEVYSPVWWAGYPYYPPYGGGGYVGDRPVGPPHVEHHGQQDGNRPRGGGRGGNGSGGSGGSGSSGNGGSGSGGGNGGARPTGGGTPAKPPASRPSAPLVVPRR